MTGKSAPENDIAAEKTESSTRVMVVDEVPLHLSHPDEVDLKWIGNHRVREQLEAAWLTLDPTDLPLSPRLIGKPGVGKTTLAYSVGRSLGQDVYILQCTMDTRPEDLLVTPVIGDRGKISYHASPLVTAMLRGGVCILDEGNRMSEKSWASLAPLLDRRRYVESVIAGIKIPAQREFRVCVTMNDDASTYELPEYIQSRLQPQIEVSWPTREEEAEILKFNVPFADEELLGYVADFLAKSHSVNLPFTSRDGVNILRYAMKLGALYKAPAAGRLPDAIEAVLGKEGTHFLDNGVPSPRGTAHQDHGMTMDPLDAEDVESLFGGDDPFGDGNDDDDESDGDRRDLFNDGDQRD